MMIKKRVVIQRISAHRMVYEVRQVDVSAIYSLHLFLVGRLTDNVSHVAFINT